MPTAHSFLVMSQLHFFGLSPTDKGLRVFLGGVLYFLALA